MKDIILNSREICDFELIVDGSFYPLIGFMNENDYNNVVDNMHLSSGQFFPMPVVLSINKEKCNELNNEKTVLLKNETGVIVGEMNIESIYKPNFENESLKVFKADINETNHPYIKILNQYHNEDRFYIGGSIKKINKVPHYDFQELRLSPYETKKWFKENGWDQYPIIGFTCRNPLHKSHYHLTINALEQIPNSKLFLNPVVGITQETDIDYITRVKCYQHILKYYIVPNYDVKLNLLNLSQRMAGPRDALFMSLIRKNYGCTHFIIGRDFSGPSCKKFDGNNFYEPYEAQEMLSKYAHIIGIIPIFSKEIVYTIPLSNPLDDDSNGEFVEIDKVDKNESKIMNISGTKLREMLKNNIPIPFWFSFTEIINELKNANKRDGLCVYLCGLSSSGKSTLANYLITKIKEVSSRPVTLLDGDVVRTHISKGLGFSKEDRSTNIRRIGYVASEIVKHQGIVIVANIAPFKEDRDYNRNLISQYGNYVEVFVNTPIDICEIRDTKGLYTKARSNIIKEFTGISSPFEIPEDSEIILDGNKTIEDNLFEIFNYLYPIYF